MLRFVSSNISAQRNLVRLVSSSSSDFNHHKTCYRMNNTNININNTSSFTISSVVQCQQRFNASTTTEKTNDEQSDEGEKPKKTATKKKTTAPSKKSAKKKAEVNKKDDEEKKEAASSTSAAASVSSASTPEDKLKTTASAPSSSTSSEDDKTSDLSKKSKAEETDDLSNDLEVEPVRWDVPEYTEEIVDEKGQYIVSKFPWKEGEIAYQTPAPPAPHEARFGYQVVVVKKPQSYWSWYRRQNFFSWTHLWYQMAFALSVCWLLTWIQLETNYLYDEMRRPGNLAADQLGKGDANRHAKKITVSPEERDEVLQAMQSAFLEGKDLDQKGSKNYRMKKIPRPKEFNAKDYMRG